MKSVKTTKHPKFKDLMIDHTLDKSRRAPYFQEKLDRANKALKTLGIPKIEDKQILLLNVVIELQNAVSPS